MTDRITEEGRVERWKNYCKTKNMLEMCLKDELKNCVSMLLKKQKDFEQRRVLKSQAITFPFEKMEF